MRHRRLRRKLGVKTPHRMALLRNLVRALVQHKRIRTTHAKAKEASAFADRAITIAKKGDLHARRILLSKLACYATTKTLVEQIAPQFKARQGGYTRVLRLAPRPGDASEMALLEFTEVITGPEKSKKPKKEKKKAPTHEAVHEVKEAPVKETKLKKKPKSDSAPETKGEETKKESEKKGGFLGALRKFLKGSE